MPAIKKSVRLVEKTQETLLAFMAGQDENWSGSINLVAQQFEIIAASMLPDLEESEKQCFYQAFKGVNDRDFQRESEMLSWFVRSNEKLAKKVDGWSLVEKMAVVHMVNFQLAKNKD